MAYIRDVGNNDVRSEGMSYGMMICVQLNKQTDFDRLWKWAKTYMYNDRAGPGGDGIKNARGYFSWQCKTDGSRIDNGVAPDGDIYFATALLFASARWGNGTGIYNYGKEARCLLYDMLRRNTTLDGYGKSAMFNTDNKMVVFSLWGGSANFTDPSYHLPSFYEVWAREIENGSGYWTEIWGSEVAAKADATFWRNAAQASRNFFPTTVNATTGLGPDYAEFSGAANAGGSSHNHFEYDAWRIAMNIAMDYSWWEKDAWQVSHATTIQNFFNGKGITTYGDRWTLDGTQRGSDHSAGLVACNAVASLASTATSAGSFVTQLWNTAIPSGEWRYYNGCLYMMALLHCSGNFKAYLSN